MAAAPFSAADHKGLLKAAIREDNPVVFLEKRLLYARKGPVPESDYVIPLGTADVKRAGTDVTVASAASRDSPKRAAKPPVYAPDRAQKRSKRGSTSSRPARRI